MKCVISEKVVNHDFETDSTMYILKNTEFRSLPGLKLKEETDSRICIKKSCILSH